MTQPTRKPLLWRIGVWTIETLALLVFVGGVVYFMNGGAINKQYGLTIGNMRANLSILGVGGAIEFRIANSSTKEGEAVFFVKQSGAEMCNRIASIKANMRATLVIACDTLQNGYYEVMFGWADSERGRASISTPMDKVRVE
jgi:hypothetical protein